VIKTRKDIEEQEKNALAPYAVFSDSSQGRVVSEKEDPFRTCFQRDRDRIIHSKAFRRLKGKTQVFVASYGDHYRSRLTHTMEVAQFSRDIARTLGLNEDLAETIALAHDLGHTPFGHAGQEAMNEIMQKYNSRFEHNEQSRRVVEEIEFKTENYKGLNLSYEVLDGLIKHRTPYDSPEANDHLMPSLEAQIVNIADEIAYESHDIDDGIRAGIVHLKDLNELALWKEAKKGVSKKLSNELYSRTIISNIMTLIVDDLVNETEKNLQANKIQTLEDIYKQKYMIASFSNPMLSKVIELKDYLYKHFYQSHGVRTYNDRGKEVIHFLFEALYKSPDLMHEKAIESLKTQEKHIVVKDYISGMTDNFALELLNQIENI